MTAVRRPRPCRVLERPLRAEDIADPYRRGMLLVARATSHAERGWLHEVLGGAAPDDADGTGPSDS